MNKYIVMQEMSAGNDSVGNMWIDAGIFDETTTLEEVWKWALFRPHGYRGKLIVTINMHSEDGEVNHVPKQLRR